MSTLRVFIVGPGRLGCSIAQACSIYPSLDLCGLSYFSQQGRLRAERWAGESLVSSIDELKGLEGAELILLTVRDDVIGEVARTLQNRATADQAVAHTSGRLGCEAFDEVLLPCPAGSIHPLQSFVDPASGPDRLNGCVMALEGPPRIHRLGQRFAECVGSEPVALEQGGKTAYHAAAVIASNYLIVLSELALQCYRTAGISSEMGVRMLRPLQLGALANLSEAGLPDALTGPIARGDISSVEAHLAWLDNHLPALSAPYRQLGVLALGLARAQGQDAERLAQIERLLDPKGDRV